MDIRKDGLKVQVSREEFKRLLTVYTPCEEIKINYYIGEYYFSVGLDFYLDCYDCYKRVASVECECKNAKQVFEFVDMANNFGFKLVNLGV